MPDYGPTLCACRHPPSSVARHKRDGKIDAPDEGILQLAYPSIHPPPAF